MPELNPQIPRLLLKWYRSNHRSLPWREADDPYATWVSEIMLQQTQVETVIPYFERFMRRFPDIESLSDAKVDEVLQLWEGLGYYSRARNLHAAARRVIEEYGGKVPSEVTDLLQLPGVGRYTAGAIVSIAYDRPEPILDGNVARVLCRLFKVKGDPRKNPTLSKLWSLAGEMVIIATRISRYRKNAGDMNQALMELGALICRPTQPECHRCPVATHCEANRLELQSVLPETGKRTATVHLDHVAAVIRNNGRYLVAQRPLDATWGGLWEFPRTERREGESLDSAAARAAREMVNIEIEVEDLLVSVPHSFTHHRIALHAFLCRSVAGRVHSRFYAKTRWARLEELSSLAFPAPQRKIVGLLGLSGC